MSGPQCCRNCRCPDPLWRPPVYPSDLRRARLAQHLPLKVVAYDVGVKASTLSRWEAGKGRPRPDNYRKWMAVLKVTSRGRQVTARTAAEFPQLVD